MGAVGVGATEAVVRVGVGTGVGTRVGVGTGVTTGVSVGVDTGVAVGVSPGVDTADRLKDSVQVDISWAWGMLEGTFGATACCRSW